MEIKLEIKSHLFCSPLESAAVQSEMEVVLRWGNNVQVHALTIVDFTKQCLSSLPCIFLLVYSDHFASFVAFFCLKKINKPFLSAHN